MPGHEREKRHNVHVHGGTQNFGQSRILGQRHDERSSSTRGDAREEQNTRHDSTPLQEASRKVWDAHNEKEKISREEHEVQAKKTALEAMLRQVEAE